MTGLHVDEAFGPKYPPLLIECAWQLLLCFAASNEPYWLLVSSAGMHLVVNERDFSETWKITYNFLVWSTEKKKMTDSVYFYNFPQQFVKSLRSLPGHSNVQYFLYTTDFSSLSCLLIQTKDPYVCHWRYWLDPLLIVRWLWMDKWKITLSMQAVREKALCHCVVNQRGTKLNQSETIFLHYLINRNGIFVLLNYKLSAKH